MVMILEKICWICTELCYLSNRTAFPKARSLKSDCKLRNVSIRKTLYLQKATCLQTGKCTHSFLNTYNNLRSNSGWNYAKYNRCLFTELFIRWNGWGGIVHGWIHGAELVLIEAVGICMLLAFLIEPQWKTFPYCWQDTVYFVEVDALFETLGSVLLVQSSISPFFDEFRRGQFQPVRYDLFLFTRSCWSCQVIGSHR